MPECMYLYVPYECINFYALYVCMYMRTHHQPRWPHGSVPLPDRCKLDGALGLGYLYIAINNVIAIRQNNTIYTTTIQCTTANTWTTSSTTDTAFKTTINSQSSGRHDHNHNTSFKSNPAQKFPSLPVTTATRTVGSASNARNAVARAIPVSGLTALRLCQYMH